MWSFLFISNHLQASGWELASGVDIVFGWIVICIGCIPRGVKEDIAKGLIRRDPVQSELDGPILQALSGTRLSVGGVLNPSRSLHLGVLVGGHQLPSLLSASCKAGGEFKPPALLSRLTDDNGNRVGFTWLVSAGDSTQIENPAQGPAFVQ